MYAAFRVQRWPPHDQRYKQHRHRILTVIYCSALSRSQDTGQLSAITFGMNLCGSLIRLFTTSTQLGGDRVMMVSHCIATSFKSMPSCGDALADSVPLSPDQQTGWIFGVSRAQCNSGGSDPVLLMAQETAQTECQEGMMKKIYLLVQTR